MEGGGGGGGGEVGGVGREGNCSFSGPNQYWLIHTI